MVEITKAMDIWSSNSKTISPETTFKVYEHYLLRELLIARIRYVFDEMQIVARYYRACKSECIKLIATEITALEQIVSVVEEKRSWLLEEEKRARNNSAILERYFASRNISVSTLKNGTQKEVSEGFKKRDAEVLKKLATQQQANSVFSGGPRKDDDEEDLKKDFWGNLKLRSDKGARTVRFGKMYRDPVTKLWWAKDFSGHGGSSYKVFKEGAKGFEWLFDVAKDGTKILNKHKGPIGLFIPYKEVIFRT